MQKLEVLKGMKVYLKTIKCSKSIKSSKKSEKNFDDTESTRNKDYDADKKLKTTKTIRKI